MGTNPLSKDDSHLAPSVYALRSRHLVTTPSQHRTYWRAAITDRGRQMLAAKAQGAQDGPRAKRAGRSRRGARSQPMLSPTAVVEQLVAGGGVLRVSDAAPNCVAPGAVSSVPATPVRSRPLANGCGTWAVTTAIW